MKKQTALTLLAATLLVPSFVAVSHAEDAQPTDTTTKSQAADHWDNGVQHVKTGSEHAWQATENGTKKLGTNIKSGSEKLGNGVKTETHKLGAHLHHKKQEKQTPTQEKTETQTNSSDESQ